MCCYLDFEDWWDSGGEVGIRCQENFDIATLVEQFEDADKRCTEQSKVNKIRCKKQP